MAEVGVAGGVRQGQSDKERGAAGVLTGQGPGGQAHRGTGAMAATVG